MGLIHGSLVGRDGVEWENPDVFKVQRFKEVETEKLPTLGFGCPLGKLHDQSWYENSHMCPFVRLAQPLVREFARNLLKDYTWEFTGQDDVTKAAGGKKSLEIDFDPKLLRGKTANVW